MEGRKEFPYFWIVGDVEKSMRKSTDCTEELLFLKMKELMETRILITHLLTLQVGVIPHALEGLQNAFSLKNK